MARRQAAGGMNQCGQPICLFKAAIAVGTTALGIACTILVWFYYNTRHCWTEHRTLSVSGACHFDVGVRVTVASLFSLVAILIIVLGQKRHGDVRTTHYLHPGVMVGWLCMLASLLSPWLPVPYAPLPLTLGAFLYTLLRNEPRFRMLVFLLLVPTLILSFTTLGCIALMDEATLKEAASVRYSLLNASAACCGMYLGWAIAILYRFVSAFQSGTVLRMGGTAWMDQAKVCKELLRDCDVETCDILVESETRYIASRMTSLFSRSAWTHVALLIRNPSDGLLKRYEAEASPTGLFVFEVVRPEIRLTPLETWLDKKSKFSPDKVVAYVKLHLDRSLLPEFVPSIETWMATLHGTKFCTNASRMRDANYQVTHPPVPHPTPTPPHHSASLRIIS